LRLYNDGIIILQLASDFLWRGFLAQSEWLSGIQVSNKSQR
jgi:hypothetical protein